MTIRPHYFTVVILFFVGIVLILIAFILIVIYIRHKRGEKLQKWKLMADLLIRKAIFFYEDEDQAGKAIPVTRRTHNLLVTDHHFRKLFTDELISAKKNFSGTSGNNLKQLYLQLNLHELAISRLKNLKWYIKAQAIQELAIMDIKEDVANMYCFTNNSNELVRMEAQIAMVKLYGFEGLKFLDMVSYPITEWQQIRLLHELSQTPAENFSGIENWLSSENKTVLAFALKLARIYHRFEIYHAITACLEDADPNVRLQAINTLGELYGDDTSALLIGRYLQEDTKNQIAIIKVLSNIGTEYDIPFLIARLDTDIPELMLMVVRALANVGPKGLEGLLQYPRASEYPLNQMIIQVKSEVKS